MNDEIKATLEWLKDCRENDYLFETGNSKMLLNYITNLQEEIGHLDKVNCQLRKKINNDIYKSRIEKAVEYIEYNRNKLLLSLPPREALDINELLNILNGRSDE